MPKREIEVVIRGAIGCGTYNAAHAVAQSLETCGASVDLESAVAQNELSSEALRGVRALVRVEGSQCSAAVTRRPVRNYDFAQVAKIMVGVVLLLMLFGAELRLRFGFRLDTIMTLIGLWIFWRHCLKSQTATA
jgi:hypothetical protein